MSRTWRTVIISLTVLLSPVAMLFLIGFAAGYWQPALVTAMLVGVLCVLSLVLWIRHPRDDGRRSRFFILLAASVVCFAVLNLAMIIRLSRVSAYKVSESMELKKIGRGLQGYKKDHGRFPPAERWEQSIKPYVGEIQRSWRGGKAYVYPGPPMGGIGDPVLAYSHDLERDYGIVINVHASGKIEKRWTWSWWRYWWKGGREDR